MLSQALNKGNVAEQFMCNFIDRGGAWRMLCLSGMPATGRTVAMKYGTQTSSSGKTAALLGRRQLLQPRMPIEVSRAVADSECWYHDEALKEEMKKAD
jgi:hypothetical protein